MCTCPAHRLLETFQDPMAESVYVARALNAVMASVRGEPLQSGVVERWPLSRAHRHEPDDGLALILGLLERAELRGLVLCSVSREGALTSELVPCDGVAHHDAASDLAET